MKKKYYFWIVLAAIYFWFGLRSIFFTHTADFAGIIMWIVIEAVLLFISYRRWVEYQEWRKQYEANLRAAEAVTKAAEQIVKEKEEK